MSTKLAGVLILAFFVLHQDFWLWRTARPLVFGFLPPGLFYHVVFTAACAGLMWLLVKYLWPSRLEKPNANDLGRRP